MTYLLLTGGLALTAGVVAIAWTVLAFMGPHTWRATFDLFVPSIGIGGVALIAAALVCFRFSGRTGRKNDPAHAIDAAAEQPEPPDARQ